MGKRKDKSWTLGNAQVGVRLDPSLHELTDRACKETKESKAEYLRRLLIEDLERRKLKTD